MKRISFFGCSFTAGQELRDHELLNMSFDDCNKLKQKTEISEFERQLNAKFFSGSFETELGPRPKLEEYNRTLSYGPKVAKLLGLEYQNFARIAASLELSLLSMLLNDTTKKINSDTDILFVGLTSVDRVLTFYEDKPIDSMVLGSSKNVDRSLVELYTERKLVWNYFNNLNSIMTFAEAKGYTLMLQPMFRYEFLNPHRIEFTHVYPTVDLDNWYLTPLIKAIWDKAEKLIVSTETTLFKISEDNNLPMCGYKHPNEQAHQLLAEHMAPRMREILCLED